MRTRRSVDYKSQRDKNPENLPTDGLGGENRLQGRAEETNKKNDRCRGLKFQRSRPSWYPDTPPQHH